MTVLSMLNLVSIALAAGTPVPTPWNQPGVASRCVAIINGNEVATIQGLECVFQNVVTIITALSGLALFVMLLIGGITYLTSGGDPKASEKAKNTMTFAIAGLVLIIAAYLILNLISTFTGIPNLLKFTIPGP